MPVCTDRPWCLSGGRSFGGGLLLFTGPGDPGGNKESAGGLREARQRGSFADNREACIGPPRAGGSFLRLSLPSGPSSLTSRDSWPNMDKTGIVNFLPSGRTL